MKISRETFDELQALDKAMLNDKGQEMFNPMPKEIPSGLKEPDTLEKRIIRILKNQVSQQAERQQYESLEEADDFDLDDEMVVELSGYELLESEIPIAKAEKEPEGNNPPEQAPEDTQNLQEPDKPADE